MTQPVASRRIETPTSDAFVDAFVDEFADDRRPGHVIGTSDVGGAPRIVTDVENVISIDHGALRIGPMIRQQWGRSMLMYGPFERRAGTMFATLILNGHNTSQTERLAQSFRGRVLQWALGHATAPRSLVFGRLGQWARHPRKRYLAHKLRTWHHLRHGNVDRLDENLAVGWFSSDRPGAPDSRGNAFVMHAALGDNGELWTQSGGASLSVETGVQNLPMCYVVVLRDRGAAYYLGSLPNAHGAGQLPGLRPLGIDSFETEPCVYAGIHQAALGQIGFRVDTRVYATQVAHLEHLSEWYGTATLADELSGGGEAAHGSRPQVGGPWSDPDGAFVRRAGGLAAVAGGSCLAAPISGRVGLVHVGATPLGNGDVPFGVVIRRSSGELDYRLELARRACRIVAVDRDGTRTLAERHGSILTLDRTSRVQLLFGADTVRVAIDGTDVFGGPVPLPGGAGGDEVGLFASDADSVQFDHLEVHPDVVDLGGALRLPTPWYASGDELVISDDFEGPAGTDLGGRTTPVGDVEWARSYGPGRILLGDHCARVDASIDRPNPGNTAYTVPVHRCDVVDVSVDVTPPGTAIGQRESGRAGLVLWEDEQNFITISMYVDDSYDGASIAIFSHLDGFEDIYDAVWSMVADKITWGRTHRLRVVSDGMHILVHIDEEPVLYRALSDIYRDRGPMTVTGVGLVANWEWGDDTGSTFENFTVRARGSAE